MAPMHQKSLGKRRQMSLGCFTYLSQGRCRGLFAGRVLASLRSL